MKFRWEKKYLYWGITAFLVIISSITFYILANDMSMVYSAIHKITSITMPFIVGFVIAYLLNPIMCFFEEKCFKPLFKKANIKPDRAPRILAITVSVILLLGFITGLLFLVIPQLTKSVTAIIDNLESYFNNFEAWITNLVSKNEGLKEMLQEQFKDINATVTTWAKGVVEPRVEGIISGVTSGVIGVVVFLKNISIGLIISIYILYSKEKFFAQGKKTLFSFFSVKAANKVLKITRRADRVFGGFITGKLIDSLIIGMLCFVGMSFFKLPFPLLISVIIGITNIIPFFGPIFGAVPSGLLILMIDPLACLYFLIFILALQQFDGNILGPLILGDSTGLSAFWVIFAILLTGGLFGFAGMVVGVPLFALLYSLFAEWIDNRLVRHELPIETDSYTKLSEINPIDNSIIILEKEKARRKPFAKRKK